MNKQIELILKYQENDKKIKAIEDEIRKSEVAQKYMSAKKFLSTVNDSISAYDQRAKIASDSYNSIKSEIAKFENLASEYLNSIENCETEEELNYLKKKFQESNDSLNALSNKLDSAFKEMEDVMKEFNKLRKETAFYQEQGKEYSPKYKQLKESKEVEMKPIKDAMESLEKSIDEQLINKYKVKRSDKKFPIVYKAVAYGKSNFNCPACGTETSIQLTTALNNGEIMECESCRRLLYID